MDYSIKEFNARVEMLEVWAAHGNSGSETGIGPVIGYFSTRAIAEEAAKRQGWYESNGFVHQHKAIKIGGKAGQIYLLGNSGFPIDVDLEQAKRDDELRQKTLKSLSAEQRRVLGI